MDDMETPASPRKKIKTTHGAAEAHDTPQTTMSGHASAEQTADAASSVKAVDGQQYSIDKEAQVGILNFVSPELPGFNGILKKRYTDFLVNEILPNGQVIHLDNLRVPRPEKKARTDNDEDSPTDPAPEQAAATTESDRAPEASDDVESKQPTASLKENVKPQPDTTSAQGPGEPSESSKTSVEAIGSSATPGTAQEGASGWQAYASSHSTFQLRPEDEASLKSFFDDDVITQLVTIFNKIVDSPHRRLRDYGSVSAGVVTDRELRTKMHKEIRRIFSGRLESSTDHDGVMNMSAAKEDGSWAGQPENSRGGANRRGDRGRGRGRGGRGGQTSRSERQSLQEKFAELGGDYLHFSVYKENKDTMEVISWLAKQLNTRPQSFQFAGTKDRRGITVQRVSVYRVFADRLVQAGKTLRNAKIGNYEYHHTGLELGELTGNEFLITLRDCKFDSIKDLPFGDQAQQAQTIINTSLDQLATRGFINYYGLQRFGTFAIRTDIVGMRLLRGDYKGAVDAILDFNSDLLAAADPTATNDRMSSDDRARAQAINEFRTTGKSAHALSMLPRKFSAEANIIRHLAGAHSANDHLGALQGIQRNLRLMYVHAYQSLVWNLAASRRWSLHGASVVEGDLVMVNEHRDKDTTAAATNAEELDADGEPIVRATGDNRAAAYEDRYERARALTADEAASGAYTIFDVVLPTPGYDILYPAYLDAFYTETMGKEDMGGLDPHDMRRNVKDLSLSGSYRKIIAEPGAQYEAKVVAYADENEQFAETDLQRLEKARGKREDGGSGGKAADGQAAEESKDTEMADAPSDEPVEKATADKLAVLLKLQLGSSTYATMALRELMKKGGVKTYKPDYGGGRG